MPVNWQDGKGRNPNAPMIDPASTRLAPLICGLTVGDAQKTVDLTQPIDLNQLASAESFGPRQGCG